MITQLGRLVILDYPPENSADEIRSQHRRSPWVNYARSPLIAIILLPRDRTAFLRTLSDLFFMIVNVERVFPEALPPIARQIFAHLIAR